jgi:hypothetical protein
MKLDPYGPRFKNHTDPKEARLRLGLTQTQMGQMLGYQGDHVRQMVYEIETGRKPLMFCQWRLLDAYLAGYRPDDWPV